LEISNPVEIAEKAIGISLELPIKWASGDVKEKQRLQNLLFPQGIAFDLKTNAFRTGRVNVIFLLMAELANHTGGNEKGQTGLLSRLSLLADWTGLEPATSAVTGRHSNQLNYQSFFRLGCKYSAYFLKRTKVIFKFRPNSRKK
jgi:site-specific DNA recombinase